MATMDGDELELDAEDTPNIGAKVTPARGKSGFARIQLLDSAGVPRFDHDRVSFRIVVKPAGDLYREEQLKIYLNPKGQKVHFPGERNARGIDIFGQEFQSPEPLANATLISYERFDVAVGGAAKLRSAMGLASSSRLGHFASRMRGGHQDYTVELEVYVRSRIPQIDGELKKVLLNRKEVRVRRGAANPVECLIDYNVDVAVSPGEDGSPDHHAGVFPLIFYCDPNRGEDVYVRPLADHSVAVVCSSHAPDAAYLRADKYIGEVVLPRLRGYIKPRLMKESMRLVREIVPPQEIANLKVSMDRLKAQADNWPQRIDARIGRDGVYRLSAGKLGYSLGVEGGAPVRVRLGMTEFGGRPARDYSSLESGNVEWSFDVVQTGELPQKLPDGTRVVRFEPASSSSEGLRVAVMPFEPDEGRLVVSASRESSGIGGLFKRGQRDIVVQGVLKDEKIYKEGDKVRAGSEYPSEERYVTREFIGYAYVGDPSSGDTDMWSLSMAMLVKRVAASDSSKAKKYIYYVHPRLETLRILVLSNQIKENLNNAETFVRAWSKVQEEDRGGRKEGALAAGRTRRRGIASTRSAAEIDRNG